MQVVVVCNPHSRDRPAPDQAPRTHGKQHAAVASVQTRLYGHRLWLPTIARRCPLIQAVGACQKKATRSAYCLHAQIQQACCNSGNHLSYVVNPFIHSQQTMLAIHTKLLESWWPTQSLKHSEDLKALALSHPLHK
jgi:hypothetical protein